MEVFCPKCGHKDFDVNSIHPFECKKCKFIYYHNIACATAAIIETDDGIIVAKRATLPAKGLLDLPGGFVDENESAEDGVTREIHEELGIEIRDLKYLYSYPNQYPFGGLIYYTCDLFFTCYCDTPELIKLDRSEMSEFLILKKEEIDLKLFAFDSIKKGIKRWLS